MCRYVQNLVEIAGYTAYFQNFCLEKLIGDLGLREYNYSEPCQFGMEYLISTYIQILKKKHTHTHILVECE